MVSMIGSFHKEDRLMTTKHVVADDVFGTIAKRQWELSRRVLEGTLDPDWVAKELQRVIEGLKIHPVIISKIFELTLDGDDPINDPMEMIRSNGFDPDAWKFKGKRVVGKQTRKFRMACVGACRNVDEVREQLNRCGEIPEGQWREAFMVAGCPEVDGPWHIGFADPSWEDSSGFDNIPCIFPCRGHDFLRVHYATFNNYWRWLVEVKE